MPASPAAPAAPKLERVVPFTCKSCGLETAATVEVKPPSGLDAWIDKLLPGAKGHAEARSWETARRMGALGACPACGKRDEAGRAALRAEVGQRFWVTGLVGGALAAVVVGLRQLTPLLIPAAGALAGFLSWNAALWMVDELDTRVKVLPESEGPRRLKKEGPPPAAGPTVAGSGDLLVPLGVLAVIGLLSWKFIAQRPFGADNDTSVQWVQFGIAVVALGVIGWGLWLERAGRGTERLRLRDRTLVALGLGAFLGYFNFGHLHFGNFVHVWDTYHYVMGAKYFPELGYEKLYDCAVVANVENGRRDEVARQTITDLRTNIIVKTDELVANPQRCKDTFTDARWAAFREDIRAFRSFVGEQRWREIHHDHGYNATPVWTLAGYALTNAAGPVTMKQLTRLNVLDPIYIALAMVLIWWAFGPRAFAVAAIVLGCHFPNRYYWTGGAFLRHDWLFYFVAAICLLKKDKPVLAGAAFAYTTLLRLFPGLAAVGPALAAVEFFRQHKKLDPRFVRYVLAGTTAAALLVGASLLAFQMPAPKPLSLKVSSPDAALVVEPTPTGVTLKGTSSAPITVDVEGYVYTVQPSEGAAFGGLVEQVRRQLLPGYELEAAESAGGLSLTAWRDRGGIYPRFLANTVKHASTPLTNHMGLRTVLSWRPDTIGQKTVMQGQIDNWARWKSTRLEKWHEAKALLFLIFAAGMVLVWLALQHTGPEPWLGASLGVGFIVLGAELTNYYYCFLLGIAVLHEKKREVGALLCVLAGVSLYLNWGPLPWMSRWLDEQYVTMSLAALFAVGGIWWLFTRFAEGALVAPEPPPLLFAAPPPAKAQGKKR